MISKRLEAKPISSDRITLPFDAPDEIRRADWARALGRLALVFLSLFVLAQPLSIAGAEIALAGASLMWLAQLALVRPPILQSSPLDAPILVFWSLCALSATLAPLPGSSWGGMRKIALIFLVLVVAHSVSNPKRMRQLLALLFLSGLVSVGIATWQYSAGVGLRVLVSDPGGAAYEAGIRPGAVILSVDDRHLRDPEEAAALLQTKPAGSALRLSVVPHAAATQVIIAKDAVPVMVAVRQTSETPSLEAMGLELDRARPSRARGTYSHYITYSDEMQMLLALAFGLWLSSRRAFRFPALGFAALALVFALGVGATLSRSAWLAATLACLVQVWFHVRRRSVRILLPLLLVLAAFGTDAAMQRWRGVGLIDPQEGSTEYRLLMWRDGLRLIREHPLLGVGMNTIRDAWPRFDIAAYRLHPRSHFHSTPMQIAVEMGLPVLLAWLVLMAAYGSMLAGLVRQAREQPDTRLYGLSLGILGASTGFLANSLVQYNFGDSVVVLLFWFLMGLAIATRRYLASAEAGVVRGTADH